LKQEAAANNTKRAHQEEQRRTHQRAIVMDVQSQREKPAQAAEDVARENHAKAQELRQEMEALAAKARPAAQRASDRLWHSRVRHARSVSRPSRPTRRRLRRSGALRTSGERT